MTDYILLIYPCILFIIYFYGCKISKDGSFINESFSKEQSKMLQAIACLFIVLHHLTQIITSYGDLNRGPITLLSSMGILFTSVFFFFSGFGLIISVNKNDKYLDSFLRHRLPTVLVPFFVANIISVIVRIFYIKIPMTPKQIIQCVTGYVLINGNGWYIVEIVFIYIAFYILFKLIRNKKIAATLLCIFTAFLIYTGYTRGHDFSTLGDHWFKGEWWYNSTIVFIYGVVFAINKERIMTYIKRHYKCLLAIFSVLFVVGFCLEEVIRKRYGYYTESVVVDVINSKLLTLIAQMLLCMIFTSLMILIFVKIQVGNKVLKYLGSISMEIFLIHGLFINNIPNLNRKNEVLSYGLVIGLSILAAAVISPVDKLIVNLIACHDIKNNYLKDCGIDLIRERKEKIKRWTIRAVCTIVAVIFAISAFKGTIIVRKEFNDEIKAIKTVGLGDTIKLGRYDVNPSIPGKERVEWIAVKVDAEEIVLVSKYGLDSKAYNKKHAEVTFKESDVYEFLNNEMYDELFSDNEKSIIGMSSGGSEYITLMSADEAEAYFSNDISRQLQATAYAIKRGVNINTPSKIDSWDYKDYRTSWWWLRGVEGKTADIVSTEGEILPGGKFVNKPNGAIRPVIIIDLKEISD